jgi:hypothetical protein
MDSLETTEREEEEEENLTISICYATVTPSNCMINKLLFERKQESAQRVLDECESD